MPATPSCAVTAARASRPVMVVCSTSIEVGRRVAPTPEWGSLRQSIGGRMRTVHWLIAAMLGLVLAACAGIGTAPTAEARQALAPTGKLRVALQLGSPHNVTRDSVSGEMKGVGYDLGKELARRIGVPFEPVMYPSVGALLDAGKSGAWDVAFVGFSPARAKEWDFA